MVPEISVSTNAATITEGGAAVTLTVTSNISLFIPLTVNYRISDTSIMPAAFSPTGTTSQAPDSLSGTLTIPVGDAVTSMTLMLTDSLCWMRMLATRPCALKLSQVQAMW